ncbi:FAD-dependent oxidoreductase [Fusobacterium sp. SYSU M8D902]|uniref:FAD-dependent oxidoreductase n=1 Tax=Fusobacterium sp. SYSU M8D902 TaxID=3159562 RepID=UPI0032E4AED3
MLVKKWRCTVCDELFDYDKKPSSCPVCGVGQELFELVEVEVSENSIEKEVDILIIGGGVAAVNAADAVSSRNKKARITIISKEKYLPYYRTRLTEIIDNEIPMERMLIKKESWYAERNIKLLLEEEVISVATDEKFVELASGKRLNYDSLVIASGARCFVPPFENKDLKNVRVIREMAETYDIIDTAKKSKKVVVIGGGVLGLEAAWGFKNLGLDVTVLEVMPRVLPRQLDEKGSELLEKLIKTSGVNIMTGVEIKGFAGSDCVEKVVLKNGVELDADLVIISAGIAPNKEFMLSTKIAVNRGIIVNEKMETSIKDIYACGDIAEYNGKIIGLWQVAMEQGKIVGANICGEEKIYSEQIQPLSFEGMNTQLLSIGNITDSGETVVDYNAEKNIYRKFFFKNEILVGALLIGDTGKSVAVIKGVREGVRKIQILAKLYN